MKPQHKLLRAGADMAIRWSATESYACTFARWELMRRKQRPVEVKHYPCVLPATIIEQRFNQVI